MSWLLPSLSLLALVPCATAQLPGPNSRVAPFVENHGQWKQEVRFAAVQGDAMVRVRDDGFELLRGARAGEGVLLRFRFLDPAPDRSVEGRERLPGMHHFLQAGSSERRVRFVPSWRGVLYRGLYDGVDLWLREEDGIVEYDLLLAARADPETIVLRCEGARRLDLLDSGALVVHTAIGDVVQQPPATWTTTPSGARVPVPCRFRILGEDAFGFEVPSWTGDRPLVIDPGLEWSTYFGGLGPEMATAVAVDANGEVVLTGTTLSPDLDVLPGAFQASLSGPGDAFAARFTADGGTLLWCTYLGGSSDEDGSALALGPGGAVFVAGRTASADFPVSATAADTVFANNEGFVARLKPDGSDLDWATFLGGSLGDEIKALAVDAAGVVTVAGQTQSADYPTTSNAYDTTFNGGPWDLVVSRLTADGRNLSWSTYAGGGGQDASRALAVDASGEVVVGGWTNSSDFPVTSGAWDTTFAGGGPHDEDAFVLRLLADGSDLAWSTFLGGTDEDEVLDLAFHPSGDLFLAGWTSSGDFPATAGAAGTVHGGSKDGFLARLTGNGGALPYSSFLGGGGLDEATSVAMDGAGNAVIGGNTASADFPVTLGAYDTVFNGGGFEDSDAFLAVVAPAGGGPSDLVYSTFFGGALGDDSILDLAVDAAGDVTVGGFTGAADFHTWSAHQPAFRGGVVDAFVARLEPVAGPILSQTALRRGQAASFVVTNLVPGESAYYLYSFAGAGNGPCAGQLGGLCLDLVAPLALIGSAVADASGTATLQLTLPANAPLVPVTTQAAVPRGPASASAKSNTVTDTIQP